MPFVRATAGPGGLAPSPGDVTALGRGVGGADSARLQGTEGTELPADMGRASSCRPPGGAAPCPGCFRAEDETKQDPRLADARGLARAAGEAQPRAGGSLCRARSSPGALAGGDRLPSPLLSPPAPPAVCR